MMKIVHCLIFRGPGDSAVALNQVLQEQASSMLFEQNLELKQALLGWRDEKKVEKQIAYHLHHFPSDSLPMVVCRNPHIFASRPLEPVPKGLAQ
jgi:hypothetical protein